jgi:hypothetical protein
MPAIAGSEALTTSTALAEVARSKTAPPTIHVANAARPNPTMTAAVSDPNNGIRGVRRRAVIPQDRDVRRSVCAGRNAHASKPPTMTATTAAAAIRMGS